MRYYSFDTKGFYLIAGMAVPPDAVEVTDTQYVELLAGLNAGRVIVNEDGIPVLTDPPTEPVSSNVPESVTMMQARLSMLNAGILDSVEKAISAIPGDAGKAAAIQWGFATDVRRDWPLVTSLQETLNLSEAQIDDLFIAAASI